MDNEMLSSLLNNPQALQSAMKAVSGMLGNESPQPAQTPPAYPEKAAKTDYDPSADLMEHALPVITSIVQSGQGAVAPEKRALLNAVKPFISSSAASQFDHAMRLVSMANMARAALGQIKPNGSGDGTQPL